MASKNNGVTADPLFVAATRPPMRWGVTWPGIVLGGITVIEMFLVTRNLLWLLAYIPIHAILALLMMHECRFFELLGLWGRTKGMNWINGSLNPRYWFASQRHWKASSYSPLRYGLPNLDGRHSLAQRYK
ncbi:MAG: type IV secretion system protein VirB3 [Methyloglobulus sp.]|nr:type IV secretion system protein VirB3 [Methyloglobulus sp.]